MYHQHHQPPPPPHRDDHHHDDYEKVGDHDDHDHDDGHWVGCLQCLSGVGKFCCFIDGSSSAGGEKESGNYTIHGTLKN